MKIYFLITCCSLLGFLHFANCVQIKKCIDPQFKHKTAISNPDITIDKTIVIFDFIVKCQSGSRDLSFYYYHDGLYKPVEKSLDGSKYEISLALNNKEFNSGLHTFNIYYSESIPELLADPKSSIKPLYVIEHRHKARFNLYYHVALLNICIWYNLFMGIVKALIARSVFAFHGIWAIWKVVDTLEDDRFWFISLSLMALAIETVITVGIRRCKDTLWFSFNIFFYLASIVPSVWLLELHLAHERRILKTGDNNYVELKVVNSKHNYHFKNHTFSLGSFRYIENKLPIQLDQEMWPKVHGQLLLVILIVGRWILPKGHLSRDQLSQLLLANIGGAADIIEFLEALNEPTASYDLPLCFVILTIWAWSLLQFVFVLPPLHYKGGGRRTKRFSWPTTKLTHEKEESNSPNKIYYCNLTTCNVYVWVALLYNTVMQDGPFLVIRLVLLLKYRAVSYMNIFFTCKNALILIFQLYRLEVVIRENKNERRKLKLLHRKSTEQTDFQLRKRFSV